MTTTKIVILAFTEIRQLLIPPPVETMKQDTREKRQPCTCNEFCPRTPNPSTGKYHDLHIYYFKYYVMHRYEPNSFCFKVSSNNRFAIPFGF